MMIRPAPLAALLVALLCAAPTRADDVRYQDYPVGSRATVLGGAFVALGDDPSGLYYNPAGICDTRRLNVNVSASLYGFERQSHGSVVISRDSFTLAALQTLNVVPGEAGLLKGFGQLDARGTPLALGFDLVVPSFRSYGTDTEEPTQLHSRVQDRTFVAAAGVGFRATDTLNLGFALHYVLRLYEQSQDAFQVAPSGPGLRAASHHADVAFLAGSLVPLLGAKLRSPSGWMFGAALGLPSLHLHSQGSAHVEGVVADAASGGGPQAFEVHTDQVDSRFPSPLQVKLGVARVVDHRWTLSGELNWHAKTSYDRLTLPPTVQAALPIQTHVDRGAVWDLDLGGEYLANPTTSLALGLYTSHSGAQPIPQGEGPLPDGASRLPDVPLYGGTATLGLIGPHAITRLGVSLAEGRGAEGVPLDPTGISGTGLSQRAELRQLFLYFFVASTFRY